MSGIMTSSRMMSHSRREQMSSASAPLDAVSTSKYSADRRASSSLTFAGTSSTTRIRADIETHSLTDKPSHGFDELADGNRFGQIRLAAALADPLFIALHGERGDGDHRNGAQLGIILDPARHFEA